MKRINAGIRFQCLFVCTAITVFGIGMNNSSCVCAAGPAERVAPPNVVGPPAPIQKLDVVFTPDAVVQRTLSDAAGIAGAVVDPSERAGILSAIAELQARTGNVPESKKTYASAIKGAQQLKDDDQSGSIRSRALSSIASSQAKVGLIKAAFQTAALINDGYESVSALTAIANEQTRAGDYHGALATILGMGIGDKAAPLLAELAAKQAEAGQAAEASEWAATLISPTIQSRVLLGIAEGINKHTKRLRDAGR